ncbi:hypothetical protein HAHI6034_08980 [Hathewaya histolytica]|uniref:Nucleotidase n=1 Tax=Hathewaya histolytica TaxID=1498 RepID=A0A4U9RR69_HATHI|nr:hypothetical protein [Hathewaya histolytica]VTQ94824.1 had-superfamily hydrolase-like protein [Hathewaya histolytica]
MKLNIGVDIDGTITDPYYWLKYINMYFKTELKPEHIVKFNICEILNIEEQDYLEFYDMHGEEMHSDNIIRDNAKEVLNKLHEDHNIYYITARPEKFKKVTEEWLYSNELPKAPVHMMGHHNKVEKARELNCDFFVEDRYRNSVFLAKEGIKVLMLDTNYNRYPLISNMERVYNWNDIYNHIVVKI